MKFVLLFVCFGCYSPTLGLYVLAWHLPSAHHSPKKKLHRESCTPYPGAEQAYEERFLLNATLGIFSNFQFKPVLSFFRENKPQSTKCERKRKKKRERRKGDGERKREREATKHQNLEALAE